MELMSTMLTAVHCRHAEVRGL